MNKKFLLPALSLVILSTSAISCLAEDIDCPEKQMPQKECPHKMLPKDCPHKKGEFGCPNKMPPKHFKHMISPEEHKAQMEAKKAEFDKRLNLSEEQKKTIEANKIKDREKMTPIIKEIREKQKAFRDIDKNANLTIEQKQKEKQKVKAEIKALKTQADEYRKENMKNFENILTPKQKAEFEKIKKEQKQEMEKKRIKHIEEMEKFHNDQLKRLQEEKKNPSKF